jgi:hypothetical protein
MTLKSAESAINGAWLTGLIVGILASINTLIAFGFSDPSARWGARGVFVQIAVLFGLAYGVKRRNRVCAVLLPVYFISLMLQKYLAWRQSGLVPPGILIDGMALALCLYGMVGAFAYYKLNRGA